MLLKLMKYDFKSILSKISVFSLVFIGFALISLVIKIIPDNDFTIVIKGLVFLGFVLAYFILSVVVSFIGIYRFYQNTLKKQGYLTNTLPVSKSKIILSNLITSLVIAIVVFFIATIILMFIFSWNTGTSFISFYTDFQKYADVAFTFQALLFFIITSGASILYYNCSLALGHKHSNSKFLYSIGYAIIINFITTIIFIILIFIASVLFENNSMLFSNIDTQNSSTITMFVLNIITLIYGAILFFITKYTLENNLNLE